MPSYSALPKQEMREKNLIQNSEFMSDIGQFLAKRNNEVFDTDKETYDAYLEHMRKQSVNEIQAIGDLQYAQDTDDESKLIFANITNVFDKLQGEEDWLTPKGRKKLLDYGEGIIKAPSTWIGLLTGGGGKAAAMAAQQGIKWTLRKTLAQALKSSLPAVGVEATAGAIQGATSEQTRKVLGLGGDPVKGALIGATLGGVTGVAGGGAASLFSIRSGRRAGERLKLGKEAQEEAEKLAAETTEETLAAAKVDKDVVIAPELIEDGVEDMTVYFSRELDALDELQVKAGTEITDRIGSIPREKRNAIIAAAIDLSKKLNFHLADPNLRITQRLHNAIDEKTFSIEELQDLAVKYNLSMEEVANVFSADVSNAAKLLRQMRTLKESTDFKLVGETKTKGKVTDAEIEAQEETIAAMQRTLNKASPASAEEMAQLDLLAKMGSRVLETWRSMDKARIALMTSQLATTIRNAQNVGLRLPLHMLEFGLTGGGWKNAASIPYNLFDKGSADALELAFREAGASKQYRRLIRSAMDIEYKLGANTGLAKIGRGVNVLNTYLDNTVKKAVFLAELRKISGGSRQLNDIISTGNLKQWLVKNESAVKTAMEDTLSVVYQKGYSSNDKAGLASNMASWFIKTVAHTPYSPLLTAVVPFPRYLMNQTEFIYKHMPIVGMLAPLAKRESKEVLKKRAAQQISGLTLLYGAMQLKVLQGPDVMWNQYKDMVGPEKGTVSDIFALLGPFAAFNLVADLLYRMFQGDIKNLVPIVPEKQGAQIDKLSIPDTRDMLKVFSGYQGRANTGITLIDSLISEIIKEASALNSEDEKTGLDATSRILTRFAADYVNSGFVSVGIFKDLQGIFDPEGRKIMDHDKVDFWKYTFNQALRSLPNTEAVANTEEFFGMPASLSAALQAARGPQIVQQFPGGGPPRTRRTPFVRQLTGMTPMYGLQGPPLVDRELTTLGITRKMYFPYTRGKTPTFRNLHKLYMGARANKFLTALIDDPKYQNKSNNIKRYMLMEEAKKQRAAAAKEAGLTERMTKGNIASEREYRSLSEIKRRVIQELYKDQFGKSLVTEKDWGRALYMYKNLSTLTGE